MHIDKTTGLLIYKYFEMTSKNKILINITKLGKQLQKLHQIKNNGKIKTFEDQINLYLRTTNIESHSKFYLESVELLNELKTCKHENVVSHNDLNLFNILMSKTRYFFY